MLTWSLHQVPEIIFPISITSNLFNVHNEDTSSFLFEHHYNRLHVCCPPTYAYSNSLAPSLPIRSAVETWMIRILQVCTHAMKNTLTSFSVNRLAHLFAFRPSLTLTPIVCQSSVLTVSVTLTESLLSQGESAKGQFQFFVLNQWNISYFSCWVIHASARS